MRALTALAAGLLLPVTLALGEPPKLPTKPNAVKQVTTMTGITTTILDSNGDGWDDIWCAVHGYHQKHKDTVTSTSGDGISDYDKMLLRLNPKLQHPFPKKLTKAEIEAWEAARTAAITEAATKPAVAKPQELSEELSAAQQAVITREIAYAQRLSEAKARAARGETPVVKKVPFSDDSCMLSLITPLHGGTPPNGYGLSGDGVVIGMLVKREPANDPAVPQLSNTSVHPDLLTWGQSPSRVDGSKISGFSNGLFKVHEHDSQCLGMAIGTGYATADGGGAANSATARLWDLDSAEFVINADDMADETNISLHVYGPRLGWDGWQTAEGIGVSVYWDGENHDGFEWQGHASSLDEPNAAGHYNQESHDADSIITSTVDPSNQFHVMVAAAGNFEPSSATRSNNPLTGNWTGPHYYYRARHGDGAAYTDGHIDDRTAISDEWPAFLGWLSHYDTLYPGVATSKNGITVGAASAPRTGYTTFDIPVRYPYSCCGPTDDGRIKPDLMAEAVDEYVMAAPYERAQATGTSYAAATVAGGLALVIEHRENLAPGQPYLSPMIKALAIHQAQDMAPAGPDYRSGWGMFEARTIVDLMNLDHTLGKSPFIMEREVTATDGTSFDLYFDSAPRMGDVKVTVCWADVPPSTIDASTSKDNLTASRLVNDVNVKIVDTSTSPHTEYLSWTLDPEHPNYAATKQGNSRDNVEQVVVPGSVFTSTEKGRYVVEITPDASKFGAEPVRVAIVVTGTDAPPAFEFRHMKIKRVVDPLTQQKTIVGTVKLPSSPSSPGVTITETNDLVDYDEIENDLEEEQNPSNGNKIWEVDEDTLNWLEWLRRIESNDWYDPFAIVPAGASKRSIPSGTECYMGLTLHEAVLCEGIISGATAMPPTVTVEGLYLSHYLEPGNVYALELEDGTVCRFNTWTSAGVISLSQDITGNVTVDTTKYAIRKLFTVESLFGTDNINGLTPDTDGYWQQNGADLIQIPDGNNDWIIIRYSNLTDDWRDQGNNVANDYPIPYDQAFIIYRPWKQTPDIVDVIVPGELKLTPTSGVLKQGDNYISTVAPVGLTLGDSGLAVSLDVCSDINDTTYDEVWMQDSQGAWTGYFYYQDQGNLSLEGWYELGWGTLSDNFPLSSGLLVYKVGSGTVQYTLNVPVSFSGL